MNDLNERLRSTLARVLEIPRVPPEERQRATLNETARGARQLLDEVRSAIAERRASLSRAALLEDMSAGVYFAELDDLRRVEAELHGPVLYAEAMLARREGRLQVARGKLGHEVLDCPSPVAADALRALADIHKRGELRTHYHAARGLLFSVDEEQRNPEVAAIEFREAIGLDAQNVFALYGRSILESQTGSAEEATATLFSVLARGATTRDPIVDRAYVDLKAKVEAAEDFEVVFSLLETLIDDAAAYEASHGEMLRLGFESPLLDDDMRAALKESLALRVASYGNPAEAPEDPFDRQLIATKASELAAMLELFAVGDLAKADERVEAGEIVTQTGGRGDNLSRPVVARVLARLWQARRDRLLGASGQQGTIEERMAELVQCQDRVVRWLSESVETEIPTSPHYSPNLARLLSALAEMFATVNDEAVDADSLMALIPSPTLQEQLDPILRALFHHLDRRGRRWEELGRLERIDEVTLAVGIGAKLTDFAIGEMGANVYEYLLRAGDTDEQMHAHLHLAKLYLDQHRYDIAVHHGQAAVNLDSKNADAAYRLGLTYLKAGKRLLGLEALREAAERFGHPEAHVALAEDCVRDDQPHLGAHHYISAAERLLGSDRPLGSKDIDSVSDWLRRARRVNEDVMPFPVILDKSLPRKERKLRKKELEDKNAQRLADKQAREQRVADLGEQLERVKARVAK